MPILSDRLERARSLVRMNTSQVEVLPKAALLCGDDNQDVLECEKDFLETFGYTVEPHPVAATDRN